MLQSVYNPTLPLAPEMHFNLGRKTHKEYLEMKRESVLKKDKDKTEAVLKTAADFGKAKIAKKEHEKKENEKKVAKKVRIQKDKPSKVSVLSVGEMADTVAEIAEI